MRNALLPWLVISSLCAPIAAQDPEPAPSKTEAETEAVTTEKLIEQLGDPSYRVRQEAEKSLRSRGRKALKALEEAADEHTDSEVRWRAGRLAQQIEHGGAEGDAGGLRERDSKGLRREGRRSRGPGARWARPGLPPDMNDVFDDLFEQLERDFGMDVPRRRFFRDDFFKDLDAQMEALRQQMGQNQFGPGSLGQSFQMRMGPGGLKISVEERDADGKAQVKTYEAPDLETFKAKYPDIAKRYLGGGFDFAFPQTRTRGPWFRDPQQLRPPTAPAPRVDDGPKLGIYVRDSIGPDLRAYLELEPGMGLMVDRVVPDSLAERLGIEAGDIVLDIDGHAVASAADVSEALRKASDKVTVRVNRRGDEKKLEASTEEKVESGELKPRQKKRRAEMR